MHDKSRQRSHETILLCRYSIKYYVDINPMIRLYLIHNNLSSIYTTKLFRVISVDICRAFARQPFLEL